MASISYKASAPGSVMLLGEYAVLHGKQSVVCAVDKRMQVVLTPRSDKQVLISSALGQLQISLAKLSVEPPFQFVLTVLKQFKSRLPSGCDIRIESEFSDKIGFGSSAAVTVALIACLNQWLNSSLDAQAMIALARKMIRKVQGIGSGADAAASVLGGVVAYRMRGEALKIADVLPVALVFSGYKTKTVDAIQHVKKSYVKHKQVYDDLFKTIHSCALHSVACIERQDWTSLGKIMNIQQGMMSALDVTDDVLNHLIATLRSQEGIYGAKISGSGLGDCVIGLGTVSENFSSQLNREGTQYIPVSVTSQGVTCEKI